jgi:hypothetical protein
MFLYLIAFNMWDMLWYIYFIPAEWATDTEILQPKNYTATALIHPKFMLAALTDSVLILVTRSLNLLC